MTYSVLTMALALGISGCATLNVVDTPSIESGNGILVTNIVTNIDCKISIINNSNITIASAIFEVNPGDNFRVISIPAGNYTWRGIYLPAGIGYSEFRDQLFDFTISAQSINYIGDLYLEIAPDFRTYRRVFLDRGREADQRLTTTYPMLRRSHAFVENLTAGTTRAR